jgi:hypothetical protein
LRIDKKVLHSANQSKGSPALRPNPFLAKTLI